MGKVNEDYAITIRELRKASDVKEIAFSLNTSQSGEATFITKAIKGELEAVMVSADNPIGLRISLNGIDGITLFSIMQLSGNNYLPLRVSAMGASGEIFRDGPEKWVLNNKLKFEVKGALNTTVNFVVRYR